MGMQLIETIEVGSGGAASIEFTGIPQDGVDLLLVFSVRREIDNSLFYYSLNNDYLGADVYSEVYLRGNGSAVSTASFSTSVLQTDVPKSSYTSNTFSSSQVYISNYTSSTNKSISVESVAENNATASFQDIRAATYATSSPITRIGIDTGMVQYSTASLYKITAD